MRSDPTRRDQGTSGGKAGEVLSKAVIKSRTWRIIVGTCKVPLPSATGKAQSYRCPGCAPPNPRDWEFNCASRFSTRDNASRTPQLATACALHVAFDLFASRSPAAHSASVLQVYAGWGRGAVNQLHQNFLFPGFHLRFSMGLDASSLDPTTSFAALFRSRPPVRPTPASAGVFDRIFS